MIGLDTNVLVRFLTEDDPAQATRAAALIATFTARGDRCFIDPVVLCELSWVLRGAYDVSKAGAVMLTRVLALEWATSKIRVLGVAPGKIDTDLLAPIKSLSDAGKVPLNPQQRIGSPSDVAALVAFLASAAAGYITGTVIAVDGGELLTASSDVAR